MATLLIIDPQVDFHTGSLAVPGANEDSERIASLIRSQAAKIDRIVITLDSHHKLHIAHGGFWEAGSGDGSQPQPFSIISKADVEGDVWLPRDRSLVTHVLDYIVKLEASGKFRLCIWPEHCIVGSPGHCVVPPILEAANEWSFQHNKNIEYVRKGENNLTEMYSALAAEVPLDSDPSTQMNTKLKDDLLPKQAGQRLVVCGQALSHCVNYTTRDLVEGVDDKEILKRVFLLENCASAVPTCEKDAEQFVADMRSKEVRVCKHDEALL